MKLSKIEKVIRQLEAEKSDAQRRYAGEVEVLDLAIKKLKAQPSAPKKTHRMKGAAPRPAKDSSLAIA